MGPSSQTFFSESALVDGLTTSLEGAWVLGGWIGSLGIASAIRLADRSLFGEPMQSGIQSCLLFIRSCYLSRLFHKLLAIEGQYELCAVKFVKSADQKAFVMNSTLLAWCTDHCKSSFKCLLLIAASCKPQPVRDDGNLGSGFGVMKIPQAA